MIIYVVRHGETRLNVKGVFQGRLDEPLNENGEALAALTGRAMKDVHFDCCISSPLKRAYRTAEIVLKESGNDIAIKTDPRIVEIDFGVMEGRTHAEAGDMDRIFFHDTLNFPGFEKGEDTKAVMKRSQEFLKELIALDDDRCYLISLHGFVLRAMLNFLYEDPSRFWQGHVPYNCSVSVIEAKGGKAKVVKDDIIFYDRALAVDHYGNNVR